MSTHWCAGIILGPLVDRMVVGLGGFMAADLLVKGLCLSIWLLALRSPSPGAHNLVGGSVPGTNKPEGGF